MTAPRVFISYSHDSEPHRDAVLLLAQRLRGDGIDVRLDRFEAAPAQGWPRWMIEQVEEADFVVVVCTEIYRQRFDGRAASGTGKGVTFEGLLSIQYLYDANTINEKFVPIVLPNAGSDPVPLVLRPYTRYSVPKQYDDLYRHLTGQPEVVPAPLGAHRVMPPRSGVASTPPMQAPTPPAAATHGGFHFGKVEGAITIKADGDVIAGDKTIGVRDPLDRGVVHSDGARDPVVEPLELLYRLLLGLFTSGDEFRRWIARGPDGDALAAALPGGSASASAVIFEGIEVLRRRGYLDAEWFTRLGADFGRRSADIHRTAAAWGVSLAGNASAQGVPTTNASNAQPTTHGGFHFHSVGGSVTVQAGGDVVAGDKVVHSEASASPLETTRDAIIALRAALRAVDGAGKSRIMRALDDANELLDETPVDRSEIRDALARALKIAEGNAPGIRTHPEVVGSLATLERWLGGDVPKI